MSDARVTVLPTGTANLASVYAALRRLGAEPRAPAEPAEVRDAPRLVLPGVGTFAAAMERLAERGWVKPLRERLRAGRPTLAVCLGLQLLAEASEESPGVAGLAVVPGTATRFTADLPVPHLGWNRIEPAPDCRLLEGAHVYFAHSFRLPEAPPGWRVAWCDYGGRFVAALERDAVLACQFHPELSSAAGLALLERWLRVAGGASC
jgi:imidazole glycerol phosphate synthase glutamine amidotransferase subunit